MVKHALLDDDVLTHRRQGEAMLGTKLRYQRPVPRWRSVMAWVVGALGARVSTQAVLVAVLVVGWGDALVRNALTGRRGR